MNNNTAWLVSKFGKSTPINIISWHTSKSDIDSDPVINLTATIDKTYFETSNNNIVENMFHIDYVENNNTFIKVSWSDGTVTEINKKDFSNYDAAALIALCYMKKALGNDAGRLSNTIAGMR